MKKSISLLNVILLLLLTSLSFTSCVDKDYDDIVTANVDPNLTVTHSIKDLQYLATGSNGVEITTDVIISGIIIGDDETGNIYKQIIIQEDSSGIAINVDISNYYTEYTEGRRIFVKCKGLFIANNDDNIELGASADNPVGRIPSNLVSKYIVKGKWDQHLTPTLYQINNNIPTNTLVKFENVEFAADHYLTRYAATSPGTRVIQDCNDPANTLDVYTSTYATFANDVTPYGNGTITGVYIKYSGAGELLLRGLQDVSMPNIRCDDDTVPPALITIQDLRAMYTGTSLTLPSAIKIKAVVTSNYATNMINGQNMYVQDNTAGIQVRFSGFGTTHNFSVGTEVEIIISRKELSEFNGVMQVNNVSLGKAHAVGFAPAAPRVTTIDQLIANFDQWESQLVQIDNVTISGTPGTFSGSKTISDGVNSIVLFTSSVATFANDTYPTGTVSVTGILIEYNGTKEIIIRTPLDIQ